ncbi:MAG: nitroreductase family deazaflavin-dependent oxidoreductase [Rhodoglobus sp.]
MSDWNDKIIAEFREHDGKVGGPFDGAHLLLLTTTGAKSGQPRVAPMMYFQEPDGIYVVASKAGAPENPAWYHNLLAHPAVGVEQATDHGIETYEATAAPVESAKRDALFAKIAASNPGFGQYQEKTDRIIPIVAITRR